MRPRFFGTFSQVLAAIGALVLLGFVAVPARAVSASGRQQQASVLDTPQRFTAFAADLGGVGGNRPSARTVEIEIKHWSTDAQRDALLATLRDKGQEALLDTLQRMPVVGTIRTPDSIAYDLHFARAQAWGDGGEQVVIATDRPIGFVEASQSLRSMDYPFTVIQLRVQGNGRGEGRMSVATKVIATGKEIVLENYDIQPVLLTSVTRED